MRSTSEGVGNAAQILLATAATHGDRVAVTVGELSVDYDQLAARSLAFARALADAHIRPGDRVAVLLRRGADAAAAFFGVLASGAVVVTVNETLRPRQIEHIVRHSAATALTARREACSR